MTDTIFALSSGAPPAAIGLIRVSGSAARDAAVTLIGSVPSPRTATLRVIRDADGDVLDRALTLFLPGPATATGEDILELHCHGGRAVVAAVLHALARIPGLRAATPGEFTRRALENGILDLHQVEGLADLLSAETDEQRRAALAMTEGVVSRTLSAWVDDLASIRADVEATIDRSDEDDVVALLGQVHLTRTHEAIARLMSSMSQALAVPSVERLRDGPLVVLAGPPNAGKSSLFNAMLGRDAAIVSPVAGTTRDVIEAQVVREGRPYRLVDTAGLAEVTRDPIERIGIDRAASIIAAADLVLWLGEAAAAPPGAVIIHAKADLPERALTPDGALATSLTDVASIATVWAAVAATDASRGSAGTASMHDRDRAAVTRSLESLALAAACDDDVLVAEHLRCASAELAGVVAGDTTEHMLDRLFARFCVGK